MKVDAMSPLNLHLLFPTTLPKTPSKFVAYVWGDSVVVLPRMPVLDVLATMPNAGIMDVGFCVGALPTWLGPISSFGKYFSMVSAWKDPTWT